MLGNALYISGIVSRVLKGGKWDNRTLMININFTNTIFFYILEKLTTSQLTNLQLFVSNQLSVIKISKQKEIIPAKKEICSAQTSIHYILIYFNMFNIDDSFINKSLKYVRVRHTHE